ncbi:MAG: ABC transporter permease [Clostridiales bacterium]|jgi:NitT/TauT family transport system permease protein|nr:ABC transporter permease [Clostridiales bacterium]MDR2752428.1 ABC transporter permease [Clostridiales bacterium]
MKENYKKILNTVIAIIPLIGFFLLWEYVAGQSPKGILKPPSAVIPATLDAMLNPKEELLRHSLISFGRIGMGFGLAAVAGIVLGFLLGTYFKRLERILVPFFRICEKLNPFAIIPIFMIFFGIDTKEKVALIFWVCIWPIFTSTREASKTVDQSLIRIARSMGTSRLKTFKSVIVPYVLPSVFTGLKLAVRVAFFIIVAAETYGSSSGLGWYYGRKQGLYNLNLIYGSVLYITVLAILSEFIFSKIEQRFLGWKQAAFKA